MRPPQFCIWQILAAFAICIAGLSLSGCGGGDGNGGGGGAKTSFSADMAFNNASTGTLAVDVTGATAKGTLTVTAPPVRGSLLLPAGKYTLTGSSKDAGYTLTGHLTGGATFTVTGKNPTTTASGTYKIVKGPDSIEGGILPMGSKKPSVTVTPGVVGPIEPGEQAGLEAKGTNFPAGTLEYRWFIAAPAAYYVYQTTGTPVKGQDITVGSSVIKLQSTIQDSGKLKAYVQVFHTANGTRTFLGQAFSSIEFMDIDFEAASWVEEVASNPKGGDTYHSFLWEFKTIPGANRYIIDFHNGTTGALTQRYQMLSSDLNNAPVTAVPIYFGALPGSFPPTITVSELLSGTVRMNFIHRGSGIRVLIVVTEPENAEQYRLNNPITIKVYK